MATTRSRPRGRESARPSSGGVVAEHVSKIYSVAIGSMVVIIAFLTLTSIGHVIDSAVQHFMLYYAGVFALITLCASVGLGLIATDRMVLNPGHRIFVQSAHRAASFGALTFLVIHIMTEILAQRVHVIDAFVPFLSPFRTFYIGLGTIAADLIVLLVITGIMRKRFTPPGKAWRWRAIHYTAYVAFVFGVWHGLLGGRPGKPYVDWSYGFVVAFVALGLAVRILANSLRPKESLSVSPISDTAGSGSAPMRAAAMFARAGMVRAALPAAPPSMVPPPTMTITALPAAESRSDGRQPVYEPGYEGPPRYAGVPRNSGPLPTMPRAGTGPIPRPGTGPMPRAGTGPIPTAGTGQRPRPGTGPMPRAGTGPIPRPGAGPMPRANSGRRPTTGPTPTQRPATGPMPRAGTGPIPTAGAGQRPRPGTGPMPRAGTGPLPTMPGAGTGPIARPATGPMPRAGTGPIPQGDGARQRPRGGEQPPWDGGARTPEPDPSLKYREPGPGMPGYRGSSNRFRGGDNRR